VPRSFAKRLNAVAPSATLEIAARASQMRSSGVDVFPFGVGEPDFEPPRAVLDAAKAAIDRGASKYMPVTGTPPLKDAICAFVARRRGWSPTPGQVCVTVGAKHALFNVALALFEEGDEVVIPTPCWVTYPEQVRMMGATPVLVPTTESGGFRMSAEDLARALTPRTKAVVLCTPCNPTGAAISEPAMRALLEVLRVHDCWIIVDEIYAELVYDGFRHVSVAKLAPDLLDRIVIVDGVSKMYAMTGWRIGWSIAPLPLAQAIDVVQGQSTTTAAAVAQLAALAALTGPQEEVERMRQTFERRRGVMVAGLNAIPGIHCRMPEGAFYAFANMRALYGIEHGGVPIADDDQLAKWMLERARVAAVPGVAFAAPGYMRFSYASSEEMIRAGLASLRKAVEEARGATVGGAARAAGE
jgi:aspartate aminotransferase